MTDRPYWCEICARKKECYGITLKPKCFVPTADRKTEPQTESLEQFRVGLEYHTDTTHFGKVKGESITTNKVETMSCQECKHYEVGKPCKPFLNECDCHYEPQTENE